MAPEPLVASTEKSPGVVIVGAVLSGGGGCGVTVIVKLAGVAVLPASSVAVQVTVVVVIGKVSPEAWSHPCAARSPLGSLKSTVNVTTAPSLLVACLVMSGGTVITGGSPSSRRRLRSVIADASGVPHRSTKAQTATSHLIVILGDPLLKGYGPPVKIKAKAVATRSANPANVKSSWRSETNTATGRHGTRFAGITAIDRDAIANDSATTMNMDASPPDAGDFEWSRLFEPIEAPETCGGVVIVGTTGCGFFATTFFRCTFFGFTGLRTGFLTTGFCTCTTFGWGALEGEGVGVGVGRGCDFGRGAGLGLGFGFGGGAGSGAGSGAGAVVVVGGSSASAAGTTAVASTTAHSKNNGARADPAMRRRNPDKPFAPRCSSPGTRWIVSRKRRKPQGPLHSFG